MTDCFLSHTQEGEGEQQRELPQVDEGKLRDGEV